MKMQMHLFFYFFFFFVQTIVHRQIYTPKSQSLLANVELDQVDFSTVINGSIFAIICSVNRRQLIIFVHLQTRKIGMRAKLPFVLQRKKIQSKLSSDFSQINFFYKPKVLRSYIFRSIFDLLLCTFPSLFLFR